MSKHLPVASSLDARATGNATGRSRPLLRELSDVPRSWRGRRDNDYEELASTATDE